MSVVIIYVSLVKLTKQWQKQEGKLGGIAEQPNLQLKQLNLD